MPSKKLRSIYIPAESALDANTGHSLGVLIFVWLIGEKWHFIANTNTCSATQVVSSMDFGLELPRQESLLHQSIHMEPELAPLSLSFFTHKIRLKMIHTAPHESQGSYACLELWTVPNIWLSVFFKLFMYYYYSNIKYIFSLRNNILS